jgi:DNA-binding NtrC family response regulator
VDRQVLIIEDEPTASGPLEFRLRTEGYNVRVARTAAEGLARLAEGGTDLVLLDYRLPDADDGLAILQRIRRDYPDLPTIIMTAFANVELAVRAMRLGAADYVAKPFGADEMVVVIEKALEARRLQSEVEQLRAREAQPFGFDHVIAQSPRMQEIVRLLRTVAPSEARTILLQGESGTGKDLAAKVIHYNSPRAASPFMNITCTALPETLLESELFGHEKGAFTDARRQKQGLFELADRGTIFLDEIGDMPPSLQAKLLRFLEEKAFRRVGGTVDLKVDVRIIAATNQDLGSLVRQGRFRQDLFYRLNVVPIVLPPLRERPEDVAALADHFVGHFNQEFHKDVTGIERGALAVMQAHDWPGNVRELRNLIERAMLQARGRLLTLADLSVGLKAPTVVTGPTGAGPLSEPVVRLGDEGIDLEDLERQLVVQAMERTGQNQSRAAELLGLSRDQLRYRLEKFGLKHPAG